MGKQQETKQEQRLIPMTTPPYSEENEDATIAAVINNPDIIAEIAAVLKPSDFFLLHNEWVFRAMIRLYQRNVEIDLMTLGNELKNMDLLEDIGSYTKLTYYTAFYPTWMNGVAYAHLVKEDALRRDMLEKAAEITRLALDRSISIHEAAAKAEQHVVAISRETVMEVEPTLEEIAYDALDELDQEAQNGVEFAFSDLSKIVGVMLPGDFVVLAARSGVGKSRMLFQTILNAAKSEKRCLLITTELTATQVFNILIEMQSKTGITAIGIRDKTIKKNPEQYDEYIKLNIETTKLKPFLHIVRYKDKQPIERIRARILRDGTGAWDLIGIDYIQRLGSVEKFDKEYELFGHIAQTMKNTAQAVETVIISPSQTNRDGAKSGFQGGDNLSGSDKILHESDVTLIINRNDAQKPSDQEPDNQAQIFVAKGRFGAQGRTINAFFHPRRGTYENAQHSGTPPKPVTSHKDDA